MKMARKLKTIMKKTIIKKNTTTMKKQILILSAVFLSLTAFAQKNELKAAEKAVKANDFATALSVINNAESLIGGADQKTKAKFYYLKAKALYKNGASDINIDEVGAAFNKLISFEKESGKPKYTNEIGTLVNNMVQSIAQKAGDQYNIAIQTKEASDYVKAGDEYNKVYALSPADTAFLDNAALLYNLGKAYNKSIKAYDKLLAVNYTGISTEYIATNKSNGKDVSYNDKKSMDMQVKLGIVENPRTEAKDSRREVIFKNLAASYSGLEDNAKALEVINEGRKEFPNSYSLLIDEANIHYRNGNEQLFKEKLEEAITLNPTEPTLYYNVGVMNMNQNKVDEAITNFKKAIELKPDYSDAYNNIGAAIIERSAPIIEEMNKSLSDFDKYDKLQAQQFEIYNEAVPFYEKAHEFSSDNINIIKTLMGLYENLDMQDKLTEIKAVYDKLKG